MFDLFRNETSLPSRCSVTLVNGGLALSSPYIPELVNVIKALPIAERKWDANRRLWIIDPKHGQQLATWIEIYAGETVTLPAIQSNTAPVMKLLEVRYIGQCKFRDDGSSSAFGLIGEEWNIIFPESALRSWFDGIELPEEPAADQTLYQILGIKKSATVDEIRTGYRRMVRQWHPDACREPNASDVFRRIQEAYELLSNANLRARYDVGLALEKAYEKANKNARELARKVEIGYRSPLRCGMIMVEGLEKIGRLEITKILAWQDIVRNGKTLVVSWPVGASEPLEVWA